MRRRCWRRAAERNGRGGIVAIVKNPYRSGWRLVVLVVALVGLFGGFALIMHGEWATSVGTAGLLNRLCTAAGFFLFGFALVGFFAMFASERWASRASTREERAVRFRRTLREFAVVCPNALVYGGTVVLALGGLSSLDRADGAAQVVFVVFVWAACIALFALYRRHRKRHAVSYDSVGQLALLAFLLGLGVFGFLAGLMEGDGVLADLAEGPRTETCVLSGFDADEPTGRSRVLRQTVLQVEFVNAEGRTVQVSVAEADRDMLYDVVEAGGAVSLTYYPRTQVLVSAQPAVAG